MKQVNWVHIDKIRSNGLQRSDLCKQCKNQVIWCWKESIGYTLIKVGTQHIDKIRSNGLERSQLGTQYKNQVVLS